MTIINSLHILLCCRENCACRLRCLLFMLKKKIPPCCLWAGWEGGSRVREVERVMRLCALSALFCTFAPSGANARRTLCVFYIFFRILPRLVRSLPLCCRGVFATLRDVITWATLVFSSPLPGMMKAIYYPTLWPLYLGCVCFSGAEWGGDSKIISPTTGSWGLFQNALLCKKTNDISVNEGPLRCRSSRGHGPEQRLCSDYAEEDGDDVIMWFDWGG